MKRIIAGFVLLMAMASTSVAATICVTTTPDEDQAVGVLLNKLNAERAALATPLPPMTPEDYTTYMATQYFDGLVTQAKAYQEAELKKAADRASDDVKQQVQNLLTCGKTACP